MDYLATITHQKLVMTRNPIVVIADPAVLAPLASRIDLRYYLQLHIQKSFQNSSFKDLPMQEASEKPIPDNSTSSPGAYYEIQTRIDDDLSATPPVYGDRAISICPDLTRQYYYTIERWNGDTLLNTESTTTMWAIRAQMAMRHYSMYKDVFFTQVIGPTGKFLTWQPDAKLVRVDQPERLYFLTNFTPTPKSMLLRVRVCYTDNSFDTFTAMQVDNVTPMTVYCMPVGFTDLNLSARPKAVLWYEVWVCNENTEVVSETRMFRVDRKVYESARFIVFQNSLGGYDTLRCVGSATESVTVSRQILERFTDYDYLPTVSDVLINSVTGERQITVNIGNWLSAEYRTYLEELMLSEDFYIVDGEEFIPLTPMFAQMITDSMKEWPIERTLSFSYSNPIGGYSRLPKIVPAARATSWRQYSWSCELDGNGIRTGKQIVNELVKYYTDSGENVRPIITKANISGTEGYIPPWNTGACAPLTTPYLNTAISGPSTFKRSNCGGGLVGGPWTVTLAAGLYGSEVSLADAQAKAMAAWSVLDTQAAADANGSCTSTTPVPLGLLNKCPGDIWGQIGGSYNPIAAVLMDGISPVPIPNTSYEDGVTVRYCRFDLDAGTYNIDAEALFSNSPTLPYKISIPSKYLTTGTLNGPQTYRFANVVVNWGDPALIIVIEPA